MGPAHVDENSNHRSRRKVCPLYAFGLKEAVEALTSVFLGGEHGTLPGEGTFSPDGKWLAFTEYSAGKREVYITSFPGKSGKWQVSEDGAH